MAAVLCTTGYSEEQTREIQEASKALPLFYSRNMSLGVNLLIELAKKAEAVLGDSFDVEIVEMHHNQKIDAPSGTALMIADAINEVRDNEMRYTYDPPRPAEEAGKAGDRPALCAGRHHRGGTPGDLRRTERGPHPLPFRPVQRALRLRGGQRRPCS